MKPSPQFPPQKPPQIRPPVRDPGKKDDVDKEVTDTLSVPVTLDEPGKGVQVAILDSWPMSDPDHPLQEIRRFRRQLHLHGIYNPGLDAAADGLIVPESRIHDFVTGVEFKHLRCYHHSRPSKGHEPHYEVPDHGLFVAGLVHEIAPGAEISVYRVLDDFGHTDVYTIARAMRVAIDRAARLQQPLVINASLGFITPPVFTAQALKQALLYNGDADQFLNLLDSAKKTPAGYNKERREEDFNQLQNTDGLIVVRNVGGVNQAYFSGSLQVLDHLFGFDVDAVLAGQLRVLVVAAAGNDSATDTRLGPRLPAAIEGVLGVSAMNKDGTHSASYSNADDLLNADLDVNFMDDGVSAIGGERVDSTGFSTNGVIGLYTSRTYPRARDGSSNPAGDDNTTGWAQWSGTSFATPIVSGFAACLWSEPANAGRPHGSAKEVLKLIVEDPAAPPNHRGFLPIFQRFV